MLRVGISWLAAGVAGPALRFALVSYKAARGVRTAAAELLGRPCEALPVLAEPCSAAGSTGGLTEQRRSMIRSFPGFVVRYAAGVRERGYARGV